MLGGGQEGGYRSGTENLPAIVGMGVAAELARNERAGEVARLSPLRDRLLEGCSSASPACRLTGARGAGRLPHHASVVVSGVKADAVLLELDLARHRRLVGLGLHLTTGEPSHVLRAIGCAREEVEGSLCFTLGRWTHAAPRWTRCSTRCPVSSPACAGSPRGARGTRRGSSCSTSTAPW